MFTQALAKVSDYLTVGSSLNIHKFLTLSVNAVGTREIITGPLLL